MAIYAIGDVQGCYEELRALLSLLEVKEKDRLWFVGDLVNRGPKSVEVLRLVKSLEERAIVVLGNHDLHLVTAHEGLAKKRGDDTFQDVLAAPDRDELVDWLRTRPLFHQEGDYALVHAGLLPQWTIGKAAALAAEVQAALAAPTYRDFLAHMYGSQPDRWSEALSGWDRLRVIVNALTRMRFCTAEGKMDFRAKGAEPPPGYRPWFELRPPGDPLLVCGHWSTLGLRLGERLAALDTGCVWGGKLSALRLEDRQLFQLPCNSYQDPGGEG